MRKMGDLELAAFCVRHAAELKDGLGQSPTQKAIVQSFLKNYDKVNKQTNMVDTNKVLGETRCFSCLVHSYSDSSDSRQTCCPTIHAARSNADESATMAGCSY